MNSYAKFGGAARRTFPAICENPMGAHMCPPPPAVRGLKIDEYIKTTIPHVAINPISGRLLATPISGRGAV